MRRPVVIWAAKAKHSRAVNVSVHTVRHWVVEVFGGSKLDRLARSVRHLVKLLDAHEAKGSGLVILSMGEQQITRTIRSKKRGAHKSLQAI